MGKIIRLTESELIEVIKKIISEENNQDIVIQYYEGKPTIKGTQIKIKQIVNVGDIIQIPKEGMVEIKYPNGEVVKFDKKGDYKVPPISEIPKPSSMLSDFSNIFKSGKESSRTEVAGVRR